MDKKVPFTRTQKIIEVINSSNAFAAVWLFN